MKNTFKRIIAFLEEYYTNKAQELIKTKGWI